MSRHSAFSLVNSNMNDYSAIYSYLNGNYKEPISRSLLKQVKLFEIIDTVLYRKCYPISKKVITSVEDLNNICYRFHDCMGHPNSKVVIKWISMRFWMPHLVKKIESYCRSCHNCQIHQEKLPYYRFTGQSSISGLFHEFSIDFLGPFPRSKNGFSYILVAIDKLSRYPITKAVSDTTAITATIFIDQEIISRFGIPSSIIADRGSSFTAHIFQEFIKNHGIKLQLVNAYQPEWNSFVERLNKTLRNSLNKTVPPAQWNTWDTYLPHISFSLRIRKSSSTGYSPFYILYGFEPRISSDNPLMIIHPNFSTLTRELEMMHLPALRATLKRDSKSSDKFINFNLNQLVLLLDSTLRKKQIRNKLSPRYTGPFRITRILPHNIYHITSELGKLKIVHSSRLIPYHMRSNSQDIASFWPVKCKDEIHSSSDNTDNYQGNDQTHTLHVTDDFIQDTFPLTRPSERD